MQFYTLNSIKEDPKPLFDYMKENHFPVYHKSGMFFRDFQYGLSRFLNKNQVKVPYGKFEKVALEVAESLEEKGIFRRLNSLGYELNMVDYSLAEPVEELEEEVVEATEAKPKVKREVVPNSPEVVAQRIAKWKDMIAKAKAAKGIS